MEVCSGSWHLSEHAPETRRPYSSSMKKSRLHRRDRHDLLLLYQWCLWWQPRSFSRARRRLFLPSVDDDSGGSPGSGAPLIVDNSAIEHQAFSPNSDIVHGATLAVVLPADGGGSLPNSADDSTNRPDFSSPSFDGCVEPFNDEPSLNQVSVTSIDGTLEHPCVDSCRRFAQQR